MGKLLDSALNFNNDWVKPAKSSSHKQTKSVVIPAFYPEHLERAVSHLQQIGGFQDIIIVDDRGCFSPENYCFVSLYNNVKVVYHEKNLGRSCTRNTGAAFSESDILVFIDQDMFLNPLFFESISAFFNANDSLIFLGCRETIGYDNIPFAGEWINPDISKEWRMKTRVLPGFVDLTAIGVGDIHNNCNPDEIISIYEKTHELRNMGVTKNKTVGFWDLPSMVISHSMAILRRDFYAIGGFPEWICGWGGEDIVLGFCACAANIPIHLSNLSSYQAYHKPYSGSEEKKFEELRKNISRYRKWALEANEYPEFVLDQKRRRGTLYSCNGE